MVRLIVLALSAVVIFAGCGLPFVIEGYVGLAFGVPLILFGAFLFWLFEAKTRNLLERETPLNRFLKADGENLIERRKRNIDSDAGNPRA